VFALFPKLKREKMTFMKLYFRRFVYKMGEKNLFSVLSTNKFPKNGTHASSNRYGNKFVFSNFSHNRCFIGKKVPAQFSLACGGLN
jgi:hypothetical protein